MENILRLDGLFQIATVNRNLFQTELLRQVLDEVWIYIATAD
jgi:hypothetical protein